MTWLLIAGVVAACWGLGRERALVLLRFLTGAPLDGRRRTDATWLRRGARVYVLDDQGRYPGHWHRLSRLEKVLARLAGVALVAGWVALALADIERATNLLGQVAILAAIGSSPLLGHWATGEVIEWPHRRRWVWPLHVALTAPLGLPDQTRPRQYLHVPHDFQDRGFSIELPADFVAGGLGMGAGRSMALASMVTGFDGAGAGAGSNLRLIEQVVRDKLPLSGAQFVPRLKGRDHRIEVRPIPRPPDRVMITTPAVRELAMSLPEHELLAGLTALPLDHKGLAAGVLAARGQPITVDLGTESPHLGIFGTTGSGKSALVASLAAQVLRNGGYVVVIDIKKTSHKWARGLPGVIYLTKIADIAAVLVALWQEADRRNEILADWDDDDGPEPDIGPRYMIVFEEVNATFRKIGQHWKRTREKDDDKESPAVTAFEDLIFTGRGCKMNVLISGQSGTTRSMGGPEIRENLQGGKFLSRWSINAWRMLAPEVSPIPKSTRHTGRWQLVRGGTATEVQVLFFSDPKFGHKNSELRKWATSGLQPSAPPLPEFAAAIGGWSPPPLRPTPAAVADAPVTDTLSHMGDETVTVTGRHLTIVQDTDDDELVTLREAVNRGIAGPTLVAVRKERHRHPRDFPSVIKKEGKSHLFSANALRRYYANHESAGETA